MWSRGVAALCVVLLAGLTQVRTEGSSRFSPVHMTLEIGTSLEVAVLTFLDEVEKCYLETPSGDIIEFKPEDKSGDRFELRPDTEIVACHATVKNIEESDDGLWTLTSESVTGNIRSQWYRVTVIPTITTTEPVTEPETTTENLDPEVEKQVEYLTAQHFDTSIGASHKITIPAFEFVSSESCHIITPEGLQHNLEGFNTLGVEVITDSNVACGINLNVESEASVGSWILISRGERFSEAIERRLPFSIHVEEQVVASPTTLNIEEGNDFFVRLQNPTSEYNTCKLLGPDGLEYDTYEVDTRFVETCGYIVRNADVNHTGTWQISFGNIIVYKAPIEVTVTAARQTFNSHLVFIKDRPVEKEVGPDDAIYCKLTSPEGFTIYDGFGKCQINLTRASIDHHGVWKMAVGYSGRVLTDESNLHVTVQEADSKALVTTSVVTEKPIVTLSCSVSSPNEVRACKFREPSGRILLAHEGVGEDRYSFHGTGVRYQSDVHTHDCGIQITNPVVQDLGLWRCALETESETYYGFLTALCPWAMQDPEVAAGVISEPTLTSERDYVKAIAGESVTMSCSIQSAIRYCYFRSRNGTVYSVGPGFSSETPWQYAGAGFDAGECSITFPGLTAAESGQWSCHVGLTNEALDEQRATMDVAIHDLMTVTQKRIGDEMEVEGVVYGSRTLEYCRFVRIDGAGFTSANLPDGYTSYDSLTSGRCYLHVKNPSVLDLHPWTVVTRIQGQDVEVSRVSDHLLEVPSPGDDDRPGTIVILYRMPTFGILFISIGLTMVLIASLMAPKKNRRWAYTRAAAIRTSFRNSFNRKAAQQTVPQNNTPMAA